MAHNSTMTRGFVRSKQRKVRKGTPMILLSCFGLLWSVSWFLYYLQLTTNNNNADEAELWSSDRKTIRLISAERRHDSRQRSSLSAKENHLRNMPPSHEQTARVTKKTKASEIAKYDGETVAAGRAIRTSSGHGINEGQSNHHIMKKPGNMLLKLTTAEEQSTDAAPKLWETSKVIPPWMKEYFEWHATQRSHLNETNWQSFNYLVIRCLEVDDKCGGAADRLGMIPFAIRVASQFKRLLFITWERPAKLEEFLIPPAGGLDWRVPEWLKEKLPFRGHPLIVRERGVNNLVNRTQAFADMRFQSNDHGSHYYDSHRLTNGEPSFSEVYRECWSILFEPSPPVAALIRKHTRELGLLPDQYVSVHVRSLYHINKARTSTVLYNAVNCASQLQPGLPIFVASDSNDAARYAVEYGKHQEGNVVARMDEKAPLHLDRGSGFFSHETPDWRQFQPSDFYNIFVDLYLLAQSRCVAYNVGGFGRWASFLSGNPSCTINHKLNKCPWASTSFS